MPKRIDLTGQRFGWLVVLREAGFLVDGSGRNRTHWTCECDCGYISIKSGERLLAGTSKSCGCKRGRQRSKATWRECKVYINPQGYCWVFDPSRQAQRAVHRIVWEESNGRALQPFEEVHHKNGIRTDNRPENLELKMKPHGAGQSPEDLMKADTPEAKAACLKLARMFTLAAGEPWPPQLSQ